MFKKSIIANETDPITNQYKLLNDTFNRNYTIGIDLSTDPADTCVEYFTRLGIKAEETMHAINNLMEVWNMQIKDETVKCKWCGKERIPVKQKYTANGYGFYGICPRCKAETPVEIVNTKRG